MRVDERETPPQEGEVLYCPALHMQYSITKSYGEGPHTILNKEIIGERYVVRFEDGEDYRLSIVQMYGDTYVAEVLSDRASIVKWLRQMAQHGGETEKNVLENAAHAIEIECDRRCEEGDLD